MKILLVCSSGMSTSLMVNKMKEASVAAGKDDEIWAVGQTDLETNLDKCDVLLIGPQMRMMKAKIEETCAQKDIPVDIIPPVLYGRVDGAGVLDLAYSLKN